MNSRIKRYKSYSKNMERCPVLRKKFQIVFVGEKASWTRIKQDIFTRAIASKLLDEFPKESHRFRMIKSYQHTMGSTGDLLINIQDFVDRCISGYNSFTLADLKLFRESCDRLSNCIETLVERSTSDSLKHIVIILRWVESIAEPSYESRSYSS
jgi:hypothetical protein